MNCAACGDNTIPFLKAWIAGPWFKLKCPRCQATLRPCKAGAAKFSSYALSIPWGILGGLGLSGIYWSLPTFLTVVVATIILDILIDSRTVSLTADSQSGISEENTAPNNPDSGND
jgi:hypothetical protein